MVVRAVRYEPVSLLFGPNRVIFEKNSEKTEEVAKKLLKPGVSHFHS